MHQMCAESESGSTDLPDATPSLHLVIYGPEAQPDGFGVLAPEWNALLKRSRFNSIFLTHEWQTTWWRHLGKGELWILTLRTPVTNELVGIAPFYRFQHISGDDAGRWRLALVGCVEVSDYLDVIIAEGHEAAVYAALTGWLTSSAAPHWDILDLCNLPESSLTYQWMAERLQATGMTVSVQQEDVAPQFALPIRYEEYLQEQVEKKQRHEIRRKQRRAEREAVVGFYIVGPQHSLEAEMDDFIALQRASRVDKSEFMTPEMYRFFIAVARSMLESGWLRLCFLTLDGDKAASIMAFEYERRFWLYNSGYDPESHAQLSPGWVLLSYAIQYAITAGCQVFDFMQGNEEYKYRFGSQDYKVMRVIARR